MCKARHCIYLVKDHRAVIFQKKVYTCKSRAAHKPEGSYSSLTYFLCGSFRYIRRNGQTRRTQYVLGFIIVKLVAGIDFSNSRGKWIILAKNGTLHFPTLYKLLYNDLPVVTERQLHRIFQLLKGTCLIHTYRRAAVRRLNKKRIFKLCGSIFAQLVKSAKLRD